MPNSDIRRYTVEELRDAASHVDRERYPDRAAALDAELVERLGDGSRSRLRLDVRCGVRAGWMYYDYPMGELSVYEDRIVVRTPFRSYEIEKSRLIRAELEREIALKWLQIRHQQPDVPEIAVWTLRIKKVLDVIHGMIE